jgi:hypothetical protein
MTPYGKMFYITSAATIRQFSEALPTLLMTIRPKRWYIQPEHQRKKQHGRTH